MNRSVGAFLRPAATIAALLLALWAPLSSGAPTGTLVGHRVTVAGGSHVTVNGGRASMMRANGETGTFDCVCNKGRGACTLTRGPSTLICDTATGAGACTGECVFFTGTTGVAGAARGAAALGAHPAVKAP